MKTGILLATAMFMSIFTSTGENCRYVSVTATNYGDPGIIQVQQGETAEIITAQYASTTSMTPPPPPYPMSVSIQVNGITMRGIPPGFIFMGGSQSVSPGTTVAGPATVSLDCNYADASALLTVKITPSTYDVNRTLILPPGTNQVYVAMESSTNLVNWADATNGVYGSPDTARFFRMRMDKL